MKQVLSSQPQEEYLRILGKGMITIPKEWRDELGLEETSIVKAEKLGDRIIIRGGSKFASLRTFSNDEIEQWLEEDKLSSPIAKKVLSLEQVYGSVPSQKKPEDFNLLAHTAKEEHAEKVVQKMKSR